MTAQEGAVLATDRATEELVELLSLTDEARLRWRPSETARDTISVVAECVVVAENWAIRLGVGDNPSPFDPERVRKRLAEEGAKSRDELVADLRAAVTAFNEAVMRIPDEDLQDVITTPWAEAPMADWLCHVATHNAYHAGQVAYIQTIYGNVGYE